MAYRMEDDSVTVTGKGNPQYSGKSVTMRGESLRKKKGIEPGRREKGPHSHPERIEGTSTHRDVSSVRPGGPVSKKMPNLV